MFAICGRSRIRVAGFNMPFDLRHTFVNCLLPDDASGVFIEADEAGGARGGEIGRKPGAWEGQ